MLRREKYPIQKVIPKREYKQKSEKEIKKRSLKITGDKSVKIMRQIIQNEIIQTYRKKSFKIHEREQTSKRDFKRTFRTSKRDCKEKHVRHPKEMQKRTFKNL